MSVPHNRNAVVVSVSKEAIVRFDFISELLKTTHLESQWAVRPAIISGEFVSVSVLSAIRGQEAQKLSANVLGNDAVEHESIPEERGEEMECPPSWREQLVNVRVKPYRILNVLCNRAADYQIVSWLEREIRRAYVNANLAVAGRGLNQFSFGNV